MTIRPAHLTLPRLVALLLIAGLTRAVSADHHETSEAQAQAAAPTLDVYLLTGQSNMAGSGQANQLPDAWQQPIQGAYMIRREGLADVRAGSSGRFGPEIGFARTLRSMDPGTPIYLIKFSASGQPLDAGWNGGSADGSSWIGPEPGPGRDTFYPGTSADDPNIGTLYQRLMQQIQAGMQSLRDQGYEPVLRGIVWMQGEQDAKNEISAGRYAETMALFRSRIEEDLGSDPVPFVFGQVLPHDPPLDRFTHRDLIRQRMAEADCRSGSDRAIPGVWMVSTDGMSLRDDTVHYDTRGQMLLGQAFGLAMLQAQEQARVQAIADDLSAQ